MEPLLFIFLASFATGYELEVYRACEPIKIDTCKGIGYNVTSMPNLVGHDLQKDAEMQLNTFTALIQYGCSSQLQFFLCSVYAPMCNEKVSTPIGPCRSLCESVKNRCQPVLQEFGFPWPSALDCSKFPPENNLQHMCMDGPGEDTAPLPLSPVYPGRNPVVMGVGVVANPKKDIYPKNTFTESPEKPCSKYRNPDKFVYINRTGRCAQHCDADILFGKEDKAFAEVWFTVWSFLCFSSSLFTVVTYLIDGSKFRYPERPLFFMAMCYTLASVGYGIRLLGGRSDISCHIEPQHGINILTQEGLDQSNCAIVFLMTYFFGMASCAWWLVMNFIWHLVERKPGQKTYTHNVIQRYSSGLHLVAWGIPAAQTITLLVMMVVDADELTGMCFVGNQSSDTLLRFVIIPELIYLVIGAGFMASGLLSACSSTPNHTALVQVPAPQRGHSLHIPVQQPDTETAQSSKRLCIFSVLFFVPMVCVLCFHLNEYFSRELWLTQLQRPRIVEIFMLKIFMCLIGGVICALWVWVAKAAGGWGRCGRRILHRKQSTPAYLQTVPAVHHAAIHRSNHFIVDHKPQRSRHTSRNGSETMV
ncbi:frizzled-4-like [Artemia franciscana]|uniref:Frizzled-4 n=1 Tax=Artemia franciscana TaxID=6661 RepID=A0AA88HUS4_ARTSF|nr:hypothetical protein QYM36_006964 [Artemia franciscana]